MSKPRTILIGGMLLSGCTSLNVSQLEEPKPATTAMPAGFVYNLPAAVLRPTVVVTIAACKVDKEAAKALIGRTVPADVKPLAEIAFTPSADLAVTQVADRAIILDYRQLKSFLKTSNVAIERHPNGMLKSVDAGIEDHGPEVIADIAAVAGGIALLGTGAPVALPIAAGIGAIGGEVMALDGGRGHRQAVHFFACNPATAKLVDQRDKAAEARDAATAELNQVTAQLAKLATSTDPRAPGRLDALKLRVEALSAQIDDAGGTIAAAVQKLSLPLDRVTRTAEQPAGEPPVDDQGRLLPSTLAAGVRFRASPEAAAKFLADHFVSATGMVRAADAGRFTAPETALGDALEKASVVTARRRTVDAAVDRGDYRPSQQLAGPKSPVPVGGGIIYVEPAKLRVVFETPGAAGAAPRTIRAVDVAVPQLGRYLALPLSAGFGESVALKATFAEDGSLLTASFGSLKAQGKAISGAAKSVIDSAVASRDAIEARRVKLVKDRADMLTALGTARDAAKKLAPAADPLGDINAQIAKTTAEATLAEAQLRLATATAALGPH